MNRSSASILSIILACSASAVACPAGIDEQPSTAAQDVNPTTTILSPHDDVQYEFQAALINAAPGDVIRLEAGTYHFDTELNVVCDNVTIRGAGRDATVLSFRDQRYGSNGITGTGNAFLIEDLAVVDTAGNAIKILGATDVTFRNVRVEWTDGPKSTNGAYGIYPVECRNVLIEDCVSIGASDAGIYVGQSQDVIVKGCLAKQNVAGIEIENTLRADVFDNTATDNTGGILVFDLPGLNLTNGGQVRVFRNKVVANNRDNFAPKGTMVAGVPAGTGVMVMATDNVEVFDNEIVDSQTSNVIVVSFLITERKIQDEKYNPYPEGISVHNNRISGGGTKPSGEIGLLLLPVLGTSFPDIFFDGIVDKSKLVKGSLPQELRLQLGHNGDATFANVHLDDLTPQNVVTGKYSVDRDTTPHTFERQPLPQVALQPHSPPTPNGNPAVAVYRAAPRQLSEWNLFQLQGVHWKPAADLLPYDLNTPLFSDYTSKHRMIRLPRGETIEWDDEESLRFPVGTVIAKTFAYPDPTPDRTDGERFLETRIELHEPSGWYGYSYIWNEEQTDAELRLGGGVISASWMDDNGNTHHNQYQVPNANQCLSCHSRREEFVPLGTTARNLNRSRETDTGEAGSQIAQWIAHGVLNNAPAEADRPQLAVYNEPHSGTLDQRARAWLEVNCAHCHNPMGSARTSGLDLRTVQNDPAKFGVWKSPVATGKGSGGHRYDIVPGKPDESILMFRLETEEPAARMPNLARNLAHDESNALIRQWILSLPAE